jgi:CRP-like cAMP-binding protein
MFGMKLADKHCTMNRIDLPQTLPPAGPLAALDEAARERLARLGSFEERQHGDYLSVQGQAHHAMTLILVGRVGVSVQAHGDRVDLAVLGSGDVVGEKSVIDPKRASATARVVAGPAKLWTISGENFDRFVTKDPAAGFVLMKELAKVLCKRVRTDSEHMLRRAGEIRAHFLELDY